MNIEALYPYIAVAYGTFGLVFGLFLWTKTRGYIFGTKSAIETQVANAVKDISSKVDEKLAGIGEIEFDAAPIMAGIDERLNALEEKMPNQIATHIAMHYKAVQATEAKQVKAALEEMGINFDAAAEEAKEFVEAQLPPEMIAMRKLLTTKIPKGVKENNPGLAWILDQTRQAGGQFIMSRMQERMGGNAGVAVEEARPVSRGFGVR